MLAMYKDHGKKNLSCHTVLLTMYKFTLFFTLIFWTIKKKHLRDQKSGSKFNFNSEKSMGGISVDTTVY
jgi:hypothetical protein